MVVFIDFLSSSVEFMLMTGKGKSGKKPKGEPSREEIHDVVVDILKEVDFNTVSSVFICALGMK